MLSFLTLFTLLASTQALVIKRDNPTVKSSSLVAVVSDPQLSRDSGGSVQWGSRTLWTFRDTAVVDSSGKQVNFFSSSASYGNINSDGTVPLDAVPSNQPQNQPYPAAYILYGDNKNETFYTILPQDCGDNPGGNCNNGSRYAIWPDSPPLVTSQSGTITGYTWIRRALITGLAGQIPNPQATLYKVTGTDTQQELPSVSVVDESFWAQGHYAYGHYGNLVVSGTAYVYAADDNRNIALAKVPVDSIENKSAYQFYVGGQWVSTPPTTDNSAAYIPVAGGQPGQGTFYYSAPQNQYIWIGQTGGCACTSFVVSTAPAPEGPWTSSSHVIDVPGGNYPGIGAYSMQAHPEFKPGPNENSIYVTYTQQDQNAPYETPLYLIDWN